MAFFNRGKKETSAQETTNTHADARILVLGSGCAKCNQLEAATNRALNQLGWDEPVGHITDFAQIASYGVMTTPALVMDGKVISAGKTLTADDIVTLLKNNETL